MPRGLDTKQKAELVAFLDELYRLGGYETQSQWAREAGYHTVNLSNALNRKKPDGLDGYTLLKLMRAAADRAGVPVAELARLPARRDQASQHALLLGLAATVDDQQETIDALLGRMEKLEARASASRRRASGGR